MRYNIIGKNINVSDKLREKITSKIDRLSRLFDDDTNVQVSVGQEKIVYKVEVTIPLKKRVLRAEAKNQELTAAIDEVVDIIEQQMIKYKNRLRDRSRNDHSLKDEFISTFSEDAFDEPAETAHQIEKVKKFEIKPMDAEDAVMEMELMGHNFFVFRNGQTDDVNVVYKRKNGTFGLIEPEY